MTHVGAAPMVVAFDSETVAYVVLALREHERVCRRNGIASPPRIPDLVRVLASGASGGQSGTSLAQASTAGEVGVVVPRLVSYRGAAALLACSERQIKRLVAEKVLPTVTVGGLKRIRVADLDQFIAAQAADQET